MVSQIFRVLFLEDIKVILFYLILNPIEAHLHIICSFLANCIVDNYVGSKLFFLHVDLWLWTDYLVKGGTERFQFLVFV